MLIMDPLFSMYTVYIYQSGSMYQYTGRVHIIPSHYMTGQKEYDIFVMSDTDFRSAMYTFMIQYGYV